MTRAMFPAEGERLQSMLLRSSLAFVFVYAAVSCMVNPARLAGYMPSFLPTGSVRTIFLPAFMIFELLLAACFLTGRLLFAASVVAAVALLGIIVFNPDAFDVLFRNVAIIGAALALAVQNRPRDATSDATAGSLAEHAVPLRVVFPLPPPA